MDNWIWLDKEIYPENQSGPYTGRWDATCDDGTVVEFSRGYSFDCKIEYIELRYSADASIQLWVNDRFLGTGPVLVGGDFLANDRPRTNRYATELTLISKGDDDYFEKRLFIPSLDAGNVEFLARVRLSAVGICEFSMGQGGFMLSALVHLADGTCVDISADESWRAAVCPQYSLPSEYDGRKSSHKPTAPVIVDDIWHATVSPLPLRVEIRRIPDKGDNLISIAPGEAITVTFEFDRILAGYTWVKARADGEVVVELSITETETDTIAKTEKMIFVGNDEYIGTIMYSFGFIKATVTNNSSSPAVVDIGINEAYLPSRYDCTTTTSDEGLNKILDVAKLTLKYCRQYIHLDSPKHCEPLACTGDYFIEMLMSSFSYGDMTLADFDVCRTARVLEHNNGEMFHPTYSLIWVRMLLEVYRRNGRAGLLLDSERALDLLLDTFSGYRDNDGIIDTPPSFMFVDWIFADDFSLHHPPKALGQGVINMFYYDALTSAVEIYTYLGKDEKAKRVDLDAKRLRRAINNRLYDSSVGLYFEGENTPTRDDRIGYYMPQNTEKRYYRINTNILACAFGVIEGEEAKALVNRLLCTDEFSDYQPYFAHFVLEAVHRTGLDGEYLFKVLDKWRDSVKKCDKGLAEGFIPPSDDYIFDHSHAWGGTPLYSLPMALTSLEINEVGMREITIRPRLFGLEYARVEIPTPYGTVTFDMKKGEEPRLVAPREVKVNILK